MKKLLFGLIIAITTINTGFAAISNWQEDPSKGVKIRLLSSQYKDQHIIGLQFKLASGWKIYGPGSEGIGLPPRIKFSKDQDFEIHWPQATKQQEEIGNDIFYYSTYKKEVILPITLNSTDKKITINLNYGLCKDYCVPASATLSINLNDEIDQKALKEINKYYQINDSTNTSNQNSNLLYTIIIAIIGGAILNIMPCVLPVLSIKLISVINHSNAPTSKIRFAFISTIIGIVSCFILFSAIAGAIKYSGDTFNWGLQFQNSYFLIFIFLVLTFFICNLLGVFEFSFNQTLTSIINKKISKEEQTHNIFMPNFLSGILAVMLATPCSAPFLGSAITFALTQDIKTIFIIFTAIGIGFALPYFILLATPRAVYLLPKPGNWMNNIKKIMASFLIATQIWIIYILMSSLGFIWAMVTAIIGIILIKTIAFKNIKAKLITTSILIIATFCMPQIAKNHKQINNTKQIEKDAIWENFSEDKIKKYVADGKVVIVDITAKWCITCKYNKFKVLNTNEVIQKLKEKDIVALRGDITTPNEKTMAYLHKHNRYAIPFNIVYGPSLPNGKATKVIVTKEELFELIEKAK
ncbi:MAG: thioredoxin family protein [Rickettsiales bacterium]|nr:thioredoxin family protein [Rickettsiales bacterium]